MTQKIKSASEQSSSDREVFYFRPRNADYFRGTRSRLDIGERASYFWAVFSVPLMIFVGYAIWYGIMQATNNTICGIAGGIFAFIFAMAVIGGTDQYAKSMEALTSGKAKIIDATYTMMHIEYSYNRVWSLEDIQTRTRTAFQLYVSYEFISPMTGKLINDKEMRTLNLFEAEPITITPRPARILYMSDANYKLL